MHEKKNQSYRKKNKSLRSKVEKNRKKSTSSVKSTARRNRQQLSKRKSFKNEQKRNQLVTKRDKIYMHTDHINIVVRSAGKTHRSKLHRKSLINGNKFPKLTKGRVIYSAGFYQRLSGDSITNLDSITLKQSDFVNPKLFVHVK